MVMASSSYMVDISLLPNERAWTSALLLCITSQEWTQALSLHRQMQEACTLPTHFTFLPLLKACSKLKDLKTGRLLHAQINGLRYGHRLLVCRSLVGMYAKCCALPEARDSFFELPERNVVSWNTMISGYAEYGPRTHALQCFEQMKLEGFSPNDATLASLFKVCGALEAYGKGREIHMMLRMLKNKNNKNDDGCGADEDGLCQDDSEIGLCVGNALIGMYSRRGGSCEAARVVFDGLVDRDVVSWTALIAGYTEHGSAEEALICYKAMKSHHIAPNSVTFACILKACSSLGDMQTGQEIHVDIVQEGYESDLTVGNSVVGMYVKCGSMVQARDAFDELKVRDVVSWTTLISGYAENGQSEEALNSFEKMCLEGIPPDAVTYACCLKACDGIGAIDKGRILHEKLVSDGFESEISISNTLIGLYAKCGLLLEAEDVFYSLPARNVVSWTALIAGYTEHGSGQDVLKHFEQMQHDGITPNEVTYCCVLKACGIIGAAGKGQEIHLEISQKGIELRDMALGKTLVGMYTKCGLLSKAQDVFDKLVIRDVMSWTSMISGYAEHGFGHEALNCLDQMQREQVDLNAISYVCAIKACGNIGVLSKSYKLHAEIIFKGFERDISVANSLISTYAKCGAFEEAWLIFNKSPVRDAVSWCSMMKGYALNQEPMMALDCFKSMKKQGIHPDAVTFICLLNACCQNGMLLEAYQYFEEMETCYGIVPSIEHYSCIVDMLARSGYLYEAEHFLEMLFPPPEATWTALLSACKMYGDEEVGMRCFKLLVELNPKDATWYVMMSDVYLSVGKLEDSLRIEEMRKLARADKKPAIALIELDNKIHEFLVGTNQETRNSSTMHKLVRKMKMEGYLLDLDLSKIQFS